jgi:peptide/nickel transport system permease protein
MTLAPGKKKEKLDRLAELSAVHDDERGVSLWREAMRRLRRNPAAIVGASILGLFVLVAVVGPFLVPYEATDTMGIREGVVKSGQGLIPGRRPTTGSDTTTRAATSSAGLSSVPGRR